MRIESSVEAVRRASLAAKAAGKTVGLVPTMGALHAGHESLVKTSADACGFTVVSIFVNPTQFGPNEDFSKYPRTFEADCAMCERNGTDLVFAPLPADMYPREQWAWVDVDHVTRGLCGDFRPGHFRGVATVVAKLFNAVLPDVAFFGAKDAQQCVVIRRMTEDLAFPVKIEICPTVREPDGLAMSSRNKYLTGPLRTDALCLSRALRQAQRMIAGGERRAETILAEMTRIVNAVAGTRIDYISAVDPDTLAPVKTLGGRTLFALAVHVGPARLIDNMTFECSP